ncbi:MAG: hypothetical protein H6704_13245 [Myxococcales bacterium]|nr:hypothetical protein [Myxococcales bacterium]
MHRAMIAAAMLMTACAPDETAGTPFDVVDAVPVDAAPDAAIDAAVPDAAVPDAALDPSAGVFLTDQPRLALTAIGQGAARRVIGVRGAFEAEGRVVVFDAARGRRLYSGSAPPGAEVAWSGPDGTFGLVTPQPLDPWVGYWDASGEAVRPIGSAPLGTSTLVLDDGSALLIDARARTLDRVDLRDGDLVARLCCGDIAELGEVEGLGHLAVAIEEGSRSTILYGWPSGRSPHRVGPLADEGIALARSGVVVHFMSPEGPRAWNLVTQQGASLDDEPGTQRWRVLSPRYVQWRSADDAVRVHDTVLNRRVVDAQRVYPMAEPDGDLLSYLKAGGPTGWVAVVVADGQVSEVPSFQGAEPQFSPSHRSIAWMDGGRREVVVWSRRQGEVLSAHLQASGRLAPLGDGASWVLSEGHATSERALSVLYTSRNRVIALERPLAPDAASGACALVSRDDPATVVYLTPGADGAVDLVRWGVDEGSRTLVEGLTACEELALSADGRRGLLRADGRLWGFTAEAVRELTPPEVDQPWRVRTTADLEQVWVLSTDEPGRYAHTTRVWRIGRAEPVELDERVIIESLSPQGGQMYYRTFEDGCAASCRGRLWRLDDAPTLVRPAVTEFYGVHHGWAFVYDRGDAQRPAGVYAVPVGPRAE